MRRLAPLALLAAAPQAAPPADRAPPIAAAVVMARLPHDPGAFTEGLFWHDGALFESTGQVGESSIRRVDPTSGRTLQSVTIPAPYFGEGIAPWRQQIISLTWQHHLGWRWSLKGFRKLGSFRYPGEGWALTSDGHSLIMSDGTPQLRFLDPATFAERRRLTVTFKGQPLANLNELEWVDGEILANVWHSRGIVRIDPSSGKVVGVIDLSALVAEIHPGDPEAVANGIAWDAGRRQLYVTGKEWPVMFRIEPPGKR